MRSRVYWQFVAALLLLGPSVAITLAATPSPADPGWPRVFKKDGKQLTVYQPQVDYWKDYQNLHFRCAIAVKGVTKKEAFGVAEVNAVTVVDQANRIVALVPTQRDLRFPNTSDSEAVSLRAAVDQLKPPGEALTFSLDRMLACLKPAEQPVQRTTDVSYDPPKIFYSRQPALLVMLLGEPQFKPIDPNRTDLMFAVNTNWDLFYDTAGQRYFLLNQDHWLGSPDVKGPWTAAPSLPASLSSLPASENWDDVRQNIPGKRPKQTPVVYVSTEPAEMIITQGEPTYSPIKGTRLMRVANTDSLLFLHSGDAKFYFLVAGRWFRAARLDGPWSAASKDLPADFARIPDSDPAAFVKASVPGTQEAQDAVLLASVPTTTTVDVTSPAVQVTYNGTPQFKPIETTTIQYAVNSPYAVFLVSGKYYCCDQGVWFISTAPAGPWTYCTSVPAAIYTIPPSNPHYNVTYVVVQSSTPTTVVYSQTSGYSGQYVAATGVLMFGVGMVVGAAIADHHDHYCYPPPIHYSYGCGAVYHHGYGGYYASAHVSYGPYGGAGHGAAYNPATGTYQRGAYAYGPRGSASVRQAYNPYTGTSAAYRQVNTAYGSASRGAAYNAQTGARAAGGSVHTAYGSAGRAATYNPSTGQGAAGRYASGQYGSAGAIRTTEGSGLAAWNTQQGQGAVARSKSGDVYAAKDGTVYKKDSSGNWSQNSGSGWQSAAKPQPRTTTTATTASPRSTPSAISWSQQRQSLETQSQARQRANQQAHRTSQARSSGSRSAKTRFGGGGR